MEARSPAPAQGGVLAVAMLNAMVSVALAQKLRPEARSATPTTLATTTATAAANGDDPTRPSPKRRTDGPERQKHSARRRSNRMARIAIALTTTRATERATAAVASEIRLLIVTISEKACWVLRSSYSCIFTLWQSIHSGVKICRIGRPWSWISHTLS